MKPVVSLAQVLCGTRDHFGWVWNYFVRCFRISGARFLHRSNLVKNELVRCVNLKALHFSKYRMREEKYPSEQESGKYLYKLWSLILSSIIFHFMLRNAPANIFLPIARLGANIWLSLATLFVRIFVRTIKHLPRDDTCLPSFLYPVSERRRATVSIVLATEEIFPGLANRICAKMLHRLKIYFY